MWKKLTSIYNKVTSFLVILLGIFFGIVFLNFYFFQPSFPVDCEKTWFDEDGGVAISINESEIIIHSMEEFNYFDEIFYFSSRRGNASGKIRLCISPAENSSTPETCYKKLILSPARLPFSEHKWLSVRLKYKINDLGHYIQLLSAGKNVRVSIDNYKVFASFIISRGHKLKADHIDKLPCNN